MRIFKKYYYTNRKSNYNRTYIFGELGILIILISNGYNFNDALLKAIAFGELINWLHPFSLRKETSKEDIQKIINEKTDDKANLERVRKEACL
ncbi:hypothetical protein [Flavobacterium sp. 102]|uniref:hypothetical protein n=1 Tax=Flavobacterium sp. 102 TaxID=2135623 RepID=UPI000EB4A8E4|nr:hypothetical protein [Flavobacterium sp. 102]RKS00880.1 hypothetical protein C8C84_0516 [Flavobacterium sp. 102]